MNGKVLDIEGAKKQAGTKVVMYDQKQPKDADNQLWFEDHYGNIRSKLNDRLVLDASGQLLSYFSSVALFCVCCFCCFSMEL